MSRAGVALQTAVENMRLCMRNILLRSANANNAKPYFFLNEMNKKDLPAEYSTAFWCLFVVLLVFLALLRNHCYFFHRTKSLIFPTVACNAKPARHIILM